MTMNDDDLPIERTIDAAIAKLTEGEFDDAGKERVEALREAWRIARELIVDHEFRLLMLTEMRRFHGKDDDTKQTSDERIARLAAKMEPNDAADLQRAWHDWKTQPEVDLRELFATYREERRERVRQELQRLFDLADGESEGQSNDGV